MYSRSTLVAGALLMLLSFAGFACNRYEADPSAVSDPKTDEELVAAVPDVARGAEDVVMKTPADPNVESTYKQAVLAGGCFWCVEAVYERIEGVVDVEAGYSGGSEETANYKAVCTGSTGHAEAVRITYDPSKVTYGTLLKVFFTVAHDPTTLNRQGADVGTQYRSTIFYLNDEQKKIAEDYIKQLTAEGVFRSPIVTTLESYDAFYVAEDYHQDYASNNPNQPYIQGVAKPKVDKLEEHYSDLTQRGQGSE